MIGFCESFGWWQLHESTDIGAAFIQILSFFILAF